MDIRRLDWCECDFELNRSKICNNCKKCSYCWHYVPKKKFNKHEIGCILEIKKISAKKALKNYDK